VTADKSGKIRVSWLKFPAEIVAFCLCPTGFIALDAAWLKEQNLLRVAALHDEGRKVTLFDGLNGEKKRVMNLSPVIRPAMDIRLSATGRWLVLTREKAKANIASSPSPSVDVDVDVVAADSSVLKQHQVYLVDLEVEAEGEDGGAGGAPGGMLPEVFGAMDWELNGSASQLWGLLEANGKVIGVDVAAVTVGTGGGRKNDEPPLKKPRRGNPSQKSA
jgi:hypothetical protein